MLLAVSAWAAASPQLSELPCRQGRRHLASGRWGLAACMLCSAVLLALKPCLAMSAGPVTFCQSAAGILMMESDAGMMGAGCGTCCSSAVANHTLTAEADDSLPVLLKSGSQFADKFTLQILQAVIFYMRSCKCCNIQVQHSETVMPGGMVTADALSWRPSSRLCMRRR